MPDELKNWWDVFSDWWRRNSPTGPGGYGAASSYSPYQTAEGVNGPISYPGGGVYTGHNPVALMPHYTGGGTRPTVVTRYPGGQNPSTLIRRSPIQQYTGGALEGSGNGGGLTDQDVETPPAAATPGHGGNYHYTNKEFYDTLADYIGGDMENYRGPGWYGDNGTYGRTLAEVQARGAATAVQVRDPNRQVWSRPRRSTQLGPKLAAMRREALGLPDQVGNRNIYEGEGSLNSAMAGKQRGKDRRKTGNKKETGGPLTVNGGIGIANYNP